MYISYFLGVKTDEHSFEYYANVVYEGHCQCRDGVSLYICVGPFKMQESYLLHLQSD